VSIGRRSHPGVRLRLSIFGAFYCSGTMLVTNTMARKARWRAVVLFSTTIIIAAPPVAAESPLFSPPGAMFHKGFSLQKGGCELGKKYCDERGPKDWTAREIGVVRDAIDSIEEHELGRRVLAACRKQGFDTLRRYARASAMNTAALHADPAAGLHRDSRVSAIDINDAYFEYAGARDAFSGEPGYSIVAQVLMHEAFHAIDRQSGLSPFRKLAGFVAAGSSVRFGVSSATNAQAFAEHDIQFKELLKSRDAIGLWAANRRFALNMRPVRVPSIQSARSPGEAFAEIGSHLVLVPRARKYLPSELVTYFDREVFSSLGH
jgi:hypothetical protein